VILKFEYISESWRGGKRLKARLCLPQFSDSIGIVWHLGIGICSKLLGDARPHLKMHLALSGFIGLYIIT
jgi:hypothetical protein